MLQRARTVPWALVVGIEHVAGAIEADPAGGTHAGGGGNRAPIGRDPQRPPAKGHLAVKAAGETEHHPDIAVSVELRAKRIFVVVARHAPAIGHRFVGVGCAGAGKVAHSAHLRPLRGIEPAVAPGQPQHLMEPMGKALPPRRAASRVAHHPDFSPAAGHRQPAVGNRFQRPHLDHLAARNLQRSNRIKIGLGRPGRFFFVGLSPRPQPDEATQQCPPPSLPALHSRQIENSHHEISSTKRAGVPGCRRIGYRSSVLPSACTRCTGPRSAPLTRTLPRLSSRSQPSGSALIVVAVATLKKGLPSGGGPAAAVTSTLRFSPGSAPSKGANDSRTVRPANDQLKIGWPAASSE